MEDKVITESGLFQFSLAVKVCKDGKVDLLEDVLVGTTLAECILAPTTHPTPLAGKVLEGIWQTHRGNVGVSGKVNKTIQLDNGNVIVQVSRVIFRMNL